MKTKHDETSFPTKRLSLLLQTDKIACVMGYGLSEAFAPHFFDILCGVWSNNHSTIHPFANVQAYRLVVDWFNWRKAGINKNRHNPALSEALALRHKLNAITATQNVDGLHKVLNATNVYELYGCIDDHVTIETQHAEKLFPDVDMFGWSAKADTRKAFIEDLKQAKLLIAIGVDKRLCPFSDPIYQGINIPTLEITDSHVYFYSHNQTCKLTYKQLQAEVRVMDNYATVEINQFSMAIKAIGLLANTNLEHSFE